MAASYHAKIGDLLHLSLNKGFEAQDFRLFQVVECSFQFPEGPPQRPVRVAGRHHRYRRSHQAVQI